MWSEIKVLNVGRLGRSMSEVVHSVNIMLAILLVGVCVTIYWIFMYDEWSSNDHVHSHLPSESEWVDSGDEELGSRAD